MFKALVVGVFFLLLVWVRRRARATTIQAQRLQMELMETQRMLETAQQRTQRLVSLLTELHEYKVSPTGRVSWSDLADFTVQTARHLVRMETVALLHWDPQLSEYRGIAARGLSPQQLADLRIRPGEGVLGRAAQGGSVIVAHGDGATAAALPQEKFLSVPYLILPLWVHSQVNGLMVFCRPQGTRQTTGGPPDEKQGRISPDALRLATLMGKQVQLTMENFDLYENRQRVFAEMVGALALAQSASDSGGQNHMDHCRTLVRAMSQEMHLPELLAEQIEFGAMLHDVGKIGVNEALLLKTGPLTAEEYAAVKKHPEIGYHILRGVSFFKGIAPIVLYHHEWVNGQGYPEGLAGEEIPLGARMVGIVDAWDAMTTDQSYQKALSKNNAVAELRQQAGTQFDPKLVDVFLHVLDQMERASHPISRSGTITAGEDTAQAAPQNA
jgi:hypothetical protein